MSKSSNCSVKKPRYTDREVQKTGEIMQKRRLRILAILILCLLVLATAGCAQQQRNTPSPPATPGNDYLNIDPERRPMPQKITLYYMHRPSGLLVPVTRTEYRGDTPMERFAMDELLKGPGAGNESLAVLFPEGADITDVEMTGTTAFVYFSNDITGDLPLQSIWPGDYANQDPVVLAQRSRELMLYSIVNTLTSLPGIANVKILIENHFATYTELGLQSLAQVYGADPNTSMPSFPRSAAYILQPKDVVDLLRTELSADPPAWERIYPFLYEKMADGTTNLPGLEEMENKWERINRRLTIDPDTITPQEVRGDGTALVAVSYAIERTRGQIDTVNLEYLHMIYQNGVWKLELPNTWLDEENGY